MGRVFWSGRRQPGDPAGRTIRRLFTKEPQLVKVRIYTFGVRRGSWFGSLGGVRILLGSVHRRPASSGSSAWPHWS